MSESNILNDGGNYSENNPTPTNDSPNTPTQTPNQNPKQGQGPRTTAISIDELFPELRYGLPQNTDYLATENEKIINCIQANYKNNAIKLSRCMYLKILKIIDIYSKALLYASEEQKISLILLRAQMQVLSSAVLRVYLYLSPNALVPTKCNYKICLTKDFNAITNCLYNQTYIVYIMAEYLSSLLSETALNSQIILIINNLNSQLNDLSLLS